jgi:hypothetical protein
MGVKLGLSSSLSSFRPRLSVFEKEQWRKLTETKIEVCHPGKEPRYIFDRKLGGPENRFGRRGEKKILDTTETRTATPRSSSP